MAPVPWRKTFPPRVEGGRFPETGHGYAVLGGSSHVECSHGLGWGEVAGLVLCWVSKVANCFVVAEIGVCLEDHPSQ